jgi:hypothetical protein
MACVKVCHATCGPLAESVQGTAGVCTRTTDLLFAAAFFCTMYLLVCGFKKICAHEASSRKCSLLMHAMHGDVHLSKGP